MTKQLAEHPMNTVRELLTKNKSAITMALPKHMDTDRMIRIALTACQKTPKLLECAPITLLGAVVQCAQLGLEPNDGTGRAWLIPFKNNRKGRSEVQFIPGYRGLVDLARRSGEIKRFDARVVHEKDEFSYNYGARPDLQHKPYRGKDNPGPSTYFYAVAEFKDGGIQFEVMTRAEVDSIRKRSKAAGAGPWVTDYDEMGRKTVTRRLCKYLPVSSELQQAVTLDEKASAGLPQDLGTIVDAEEVETAETTAEDSVPDPQGGGEGTSKAQNGGETKPGIQQATLDVDKTTTTEIGGKDGHWIYEKGGKKRKFYTRDKAVFNAAKNAKKENRKVKIDFEETDLGLEALQIASA